MVSTNYIGCPIFRLSRGFRFSFHAVPSSYEYSVSIFRLSPFSSYLGYVYVVDHGLIYRGSATV